MVDWGGGVFAGCLLQVQLFVSTCNGQPHLAVNCHFDDYKAWLVRFPCKTCYIRILGFSLLVLVKRLVQLGLMDPVFAPVKRLAGKIVSKMMYSIVC